MYNILLIIFLIGMIVSFILTVFFVWKMMNDAHFYFDYKHLVISFIAIIVFTICFSITLNTLGIQKDRDKIRTILYDNYENVEFVGNDSKTNGYFKVNDITYKYDYNSMMNVLKIINVADNNDVKVISVE
jgi:hypothetical protein